MVVLVVGGWELGVVVDSSLSFCYSTRGVQLLCIIESVMMEHHHLISCDSYPSSIHVCLMVDDESRMGNDGL